MRHIIIIIIIIITSLNSFSQNIDDKEYIYFYRIDLGTIKPSLFPEYSNKLSKDSIICIELVIIFNSDVDTNKYGGMYALNDPRNYIHIYQEDQRLEGIKTGEKYFVKVERGKKLKFKYINPFNGGLEEELNVDIINNKGSYQLNRIIIEEGNGDELLIPIIESKRPILEEEITEIINCMRNNFFKVNELKIFKDKTALLYYEY